MNIFFNLGLLMTLCEWLEQPIFTTIAFSVVLVALALSGLALGWFLTGKSRIVKGACGLDPNKRRNLKDCGKNVQCDLCRKEKSDEEN